MKRALLVSLSLAGGLGLVLIGTARTPPAKIQQITLQRTMCFGTCPAYTLTLKADGTAIYKGEAHVARKGTWRGKFWARDLERLGAAMEELGSARWKKSYDVDVTDQPSQIVTIVTSDGKRTISEYGSSGPPGLWALQTMIDGIGANVRDWSQAKR